MLFLRREGMEPALVRRPASAPYEKLLRELLACEHLLENTQDDALAITSFAIGVVITFLHSNSAVKNSGITNPLAMIFNALNDCRHGGRPRLIFDRPRQKGRPTDQAFDAVKATVAMAAEVLVTAGLPRSQAGRYVAEQARKLGIRFLDGTDLNGAGVLRWRDEIEVSKSEIGTEIFKQLKAARALGPRVISIGQAKALAKKYLVQLRFAGFMSSSNPPHSTSAEAETDAPATGS